MCGFRAVSKIYQERGKCSQSASSHAEERGRGHVLLHAWGGFPPGWRLPVGAGLGWQDLHGEGMGMGISLHHFLYFLAFELCK